MFIKELKSQNIYYVIDDGTIVVTDKNYDVWFENLISNIQFNNLGGVRINNLETIGNNIQFNNSENV